MGAVPELCCVKLDIGFTSKASHRYQMHLLAGLLTYSDLHSVDLPSVSPVVLWRSAPNFVAGFSASLFHPCGYQKIL